EAYLVGVDQAPLPDRSSERARWGFDGRRRIARQHLPFLDCNPPVGIVSRPFERDHRARVELTDPSRLVRIAPTSPDDELDGGHGPPAEVRGECRVATLELRHDLPVCTDRLGECVARNVTSLREGAN